ncbi:MAG: hypothetical protein ACR2L2_16415 [Acidobacteriota bacterium]
MQGTPKRAIERLPDAGTIGNWLRRQGTGSGVEKLKKLTEEVMRSYLEHQPEEITLDVYAVRRNSQF